MGVQDDEIPVMLDVLRGKIAFGPKRHDSPLGVVMKGLGAIEAAGAGFAHGTEQYQKQHGYKGRLFDYISHPSRFYKEARAGFSEVPDAVSEGYNYSDFVRESTKPGSMMHKFAMPIGLGMAILFDPTTYLTFGATSVSKTAAYRMLAQSDLQVAKKADKLITGNFGKTIDTVHGPIRADYNNWDAIFSHVKVSSGAPFTIGDALDQLKAVGLQTKSDIRRTRTYITEQGDIVNAGIRQRLGAALLPTNVKGGRGTRFMGRTIPGTPALGARLGAKGHEGVTKAFPITEAIIPNWAARHVVDDGLRASSLVEMSRYRTGIQRAQMEIGRNVREMQRPLVRSGDPQLGDVLDFSVTRMLPDHGMWDQLGEKLRPEVVTSKAMNRFFPVAMMPDGEIRVGLPGMSHGDALTQADMDRWVPGAEQFMQAEWKQLQDQGMIEGTGVLDDSGHVLQVNAGNDFVKNPARPEGQGTGVDFRAGGPEDVSERMKQAAERVFHGSSDEEVLHNIADTGKPTFQRVLVKPRERYGILDKSDDALAPAQKALKNNINVAVDVHIENAVEAGVSEKQLRTLWNQLKDYYDDPLLALAEFKFKATARTMGHTFVKNVLRDRRFAMPMVRKDAENVGPTALKTPPPGFSEFNWGGARYAVRNSMIEGLKDITNPVRLDTQMQRGFRRLNMIQDWWKLYATSPNPAFHVMNMMGAMWNNALAGVYNPIDYFDALRTLYRGRKEEAAQIGAGFGITRRVPKSTQQGREAQALLQEAEARSGLGRTSFLFGDISRGHYTPQQLALSDQPLAEDAPMMKRLAQESLESGRRKLIEPPEGMSKKRFYGVTTPRRAVGAGLLATGNPLGFVAFMPELAKAGRRLGGTIEDFVRLAPFQKYANDPQIRRALAEYGPINSSMRIVHKGFTKQDQQIMYDLGADISRQFQFDYSDLTNFERYIAKSIFPFWTYYKNNLALQVREISRRPMLFGVALKTMTYINENGENYALGPWKEILPTYFNTLNAFQIPVPNEVRGMLGLPKDQPLFLNPKMPFLSLNLIPNLWAVLRDPNETTPQKMREIMAPIMGAWGPFSPFPVGPGSKILLEAGTGYNLGLNRPIDYQRGESGDLRQGYTAAPGWMQYLPDALSKKFFGAFKDPATGQMMITHTSSYVLEQMSSPFINNLGSSIPLAGGTEEENGRQKANLVSWLTGARLIPFDVLRANRNTAYDLLNRLEAKQSELRDQGKMLSPEEMEALALVRADLKGIEAAWDERENPDAQP
jgi:hypothetical protein